MTVDVTSLVFEVANAIEQNKCMPLEKALFHKLLILDVYGSWKRLVNVPPDAPPFINEQNGVLETLEMRKAFVEWIAHKIGIYRAQVKTSHEKVLKLEAVRGDINAAIDRHKRPRISTSPNDALDVFDKYEADMWFAFTSIFHDMMNMIDFKIKGRVPLPSNAREMKLYDLMTHFDACKSEQCDKCRTLLNRMRFHAFICKEEKCPVPYCEEAKQHLKKIAENYRGIQKEEIL